MDKNSKIFVAGHKGLVGSSIVRNLEKKGYRNIIKRTRQELDLEDYSAVDKFFESEKPEYVFLAAAKVGGIIANNTYRADFIYQNLQIQNNVVHFSYKHDVRKLMFLGSSCIYPQKASQPLKEDYLLSDRLEYTNEPYAIAKIAGIKLCESYNIQYDTNFISVMPTNLYGPNDNYDLEKSHVLPALLRKMHLGKQLAENNWEMIRKDLNKRPVEGISGSSSEENILSILSKYGIAKKGNDVIITLWGTGNPYREFLHSDDMSDACVFLMETIDFNDLIPKDQKEIRNTHINIGVGEDITIRDMANLVKNIIGFDGLLEWDHSKPDGTYRKLLDVTKLNKLGWKAKISLKEGIEKVYNEYIL